MNVPECKAASSMNHQSKRLSPAYRLPLANLCAATFLRRSTVANRGLRHMPQSVRPLAYARYSRHFR
jgi:hypothetical protein